MLDTKRKIREGEISTSEFPYLYDYEQGIRPRSKAEIELKKKQSAEQYVEFLIESVERSKILLDRMSEFLDETE